MAEDSKDAEEANGKARQRGARQGAPNEAQEDFQAT